MRIGSLSPRMTVPNQTLEFLLQDHLADDDGCGCDPIAALARRGDAYPVELIEAHGWPLRL